MEQTYFICEDDLLLKYGWPCCSKVPLYKETKNKEFTSKLCVKQSIILSDILKSLSLLDENLLITDKSSTSVCKKCARKIVNCGSLFEELRSSITKKKNDVEVNSDSGCASIVVGKRSLTTSSPSGFTPVKKAAKSGANINGNIVNDRPLISRKSLFNHEQEASSVFCKQSFPQGTSPADSNNMDDAIANLTCLPVKEREDNSCIVKFTHRNNIILTTGGCKCEEIDYFHRLGLSSHRNTLRNIQERLSKNHDEDVKKWKESALIVIKKISLLKDVMSRQDQQNIANNMDVCTIDFSETSVASLSSYTGKVYRACLKMPPETVNELYEDVQIVQALDTLEKQPTPSFRIVGDNWDLNVKARCQTKGKTNQSLHYFNEYAIKDRVLVPHQQNTGPKLKLESLEMSHLLPTEAVQDNIIWSLTKIIPRGIVKYLKAYKEFHNFVVYHIEHPYSHETKQKSEVCPLGMHFLNSNKAAEIAQIIEDLQEKYVPIYNVNKHYVLQQIVFDSDQLTEEWTRNAQWANTLAGSPVDQLDGFTTSFEESANELGTTCSLMNKTGKTNAKKGPDKDYNAYKDFFTRETEGHIVAKWMIFAGMDDLQSSPSIRPIPTDISQWDDNMKRDWLHNQSTSFLQEIFGNTEISQNIIELEKAHQEGFHCRYPQCNMKFPLHSTRVRHEHDRHTIVIDGGGDENQDSFGYFKCRGPCPFVFTTKATRKRHEETKHPDSDQVEQDVKSLKADDNIYNYHKSRMQLGLLFMNIEDSIKEGDGNRLLDCYKFINFKGTPGGNIPLDLHMEHMNMMVKRLAKGMGANVTEKSLQQAERSILALNKVRECIADDCFKKTQSGWHSQKNPEEGVKIIAHDLLMGEVFHKKEKRQGYHSFSKFKSNLLDVDYRDYFKWIREKLIH
ncbi:PREDICTED: uncharacterized protein LOC107327384 [Paramuricea clavata]|uniref:PREDICTED: uncharacterized protein LOC107327384 n=1 Tax=Paramuricea clavata TaxID=317549 RepID=A0A6S7FTA2_PARCT|nr:PREDICTED: uncharacterized protein LOC107327384 [Paramuricea clavata]